MKGKEPDCLECVGTLQPENQLPFVIFWRCKNQVIVGTGYPIDLRLDVVRSEIARELSEKDDQDYCLDLITAGFAEYMQRLRDKDEATKRPE